MGFFKVVINKWGREGGDARGEAGGQRRVRCVRLHGACWFLHKSGRVADEAVAEAGRRWLWLVSCLAGWLWLAIAGCWLMVILAPTVK